MSKFTYWTLVEPGVYASLGQLSMWDFYSGKANSRPRQTGNYLKEGRLSLLGHKILLGTWIWGQDSFFIDFFFLVISHPKSLYTLHWSSLMAQMIKSLHSVKTWVQSLGQEDPLKKGMATHSNILARRSQRKGGAWRDTVHGVAKSRTRLTE